MHLYPKKISMKYTNPITEQEVFVLAKDFFKNVASGVPGKNMDRLFRYPDSRIYVPDGKAFSLQEHQDLHTQWTSEKHEFGKFRIIPLSDNPPRVRAVGTLYWEARYIEDIPAEAAVIKAVVGEDWIIERKPDGTVCFVLYISSFYQPLPGSAPIRI
jgi:hypothetical protein